MSYSGIADSAIGVFYADKEHADNGCGEAAVATLVDFYSVGPYAGSDPRALVDRIYSDHPPDTPWHWWGCTPGHVRNICASSGLPANWSWSDDQHRDAALAGLKASVASQQPVIVLVDLGKLGGPWNAHYVVCYAFDDTGVHLTNMIQNVNGQPTGVGKVHVDYRTFLDAWHCWLLNVPGGGFQYAAITAAPSVKQQSSPGLHAMALKQPEDVAVQAMQAPSLTRSVPSVPEGGGAILALEAAPGTAPDIVVTGPPTVFPCSRPGSHLGSWAILIADSAVGFGDFHPISGRVDSPHWVPYGSIARVWLGALTLTTVRFEGIDGSQTFVQFKSQELARAAFDTIFAAGRARGLFTT